MKKIKAFVLLAVVGIAMILTFCKKEEATLPAPKPTSVEAWVYDAGFTPNTLDQTLPIEWQLKAKPLNNQDNGIQITWDSALGNGTSPNGPITLNNYEYMQLGYQFLGGNTWQEGYQIAWYTNDQQICYVNWIGMLHAQWIGVWWGPTYPNTTVISLFCYRPNPNYNGHNDRWLTPYQDFVVVSVVN